MPLLKRAEGVSTYRQHLERKRTKHGVCGKPHIVDCDEKPRQPQQAEITNVRFEFIVIRHSLCVTEYLIIRRKEKIEEQFEQCWFGILSRRKSVSANSYGPNTMWSGALNLGHSPSSIAGYPLPRHRSRFFQIGSSRTLLCRDPRRYFSALAPADSKTVGGAAEGLRLRDATFRAWSGRLDQFARSNKAGDEMINLYGNKNEKPGIESPEEQFNGLRRSRPLMR